MLVFWLVQYVRFYIDTCGYTYPSLSPSPFHFDPLVALASLLLRYPAPMRDAYFSTEVNRGRKEARRELVGGEEGRGGGYTMKFQKFVLGELVKVLGKCVW